MNHLSSTRILPQFNASLALCIDGEICGHVPSGYKNPLYLGCAGRARDLIDASGLQRQQVAAMSGLSNAAVIHVEDAHHVPRLSTLERLAVALGISPTWLAYGDEGTLRFRHRRLRSPVPYDPPEPDPAVRPHRDEWRLVAERLKRTRRSLGLTLRDIGTAAGISAQGVLLIEKGESNPVISTIEQLAVALDVSPGWLAFGEGEGPMLTPETATSSQRRPGTQ